MNRPLVAVLMSALVFPGAGHLYLRRSARGMLFLAPALLAVFFFGDALWGPIEDILARVQNGTLDADLAQLTLEVSRQLASVSARLNLSAWILIGCWAGAIADCYWIARRPPPGRV